MNEKPDFAKLVEDWIGDSDLDYQEATLIAVKAYIMGMRRAAQIVNGQGWCHCAYCTELRTDMEKEAREIEEVK